MNNKVCLLVLVVTLFILSASALATESEFFPDPEEFFSGSVSGMGWAGSGIGVWYPNLTGLNEALGVEIDVPIPIMTGQGEGGIIPGFSIGGFGGGNKVSKDNVYLEAGFGGLMFNRTLPLKEGHWFYGGIIGGGQAELVIDHTVTDPTNVSDAVGSPQQSYLRTSYFALGPQIGFQVPITPFIQFRATAAYLLTVGGEWDLVGVGELPGGTVNWGGPMAQLAIVFGGSGKAEINLPDLSDEATQDL